MALPRFLSMFSLAGVHLIFLAFVLLYPAAGWLESDVININTALHAVATDQPDLANGVPLEYVLLLNHGFQGFRSYGLGAVYPSDFREVDNSKSLFDLLTELEPYLKNNVPEIAQAASVHLFFAELINPKKKGYMKVALQFLDDKIREGILVYKIREDVLSWFKKTAELFSTMAALSANEMIKAKNEFIVAANRSANLAESALVTRALLMWRDQLEETIHQEAPALFWNSVKRDAGWAHARKGVEKQSGNLVAEPNLVL